MADANVHAEAATMLQDAHDHIVKKGWAKGSFRNSQGAVCMLQALRDVDGVKHGKVVDAEVKRVVLAHLPKWAVAGQGDTADGAIPRFNDSATTVQDDVLTLLRACVTIEKELAN